METSAQTKDAPYRYNINSSLLESMIFMAFK